MTTSYAEGWRAYLLGRPQRECATAEALRGWWAAKAATAAGMAVDYLYLTGRADRVEAFVESLWDITRPEPGIEDDYEWIRRGC